MLGISSNNSKLIIPEHFNALKMISESDTTKVVIRSFTIFSLAFFIFIFLPWTQNIRANGYVTSLRPDKRPQNIHSVIPGKIEKWYVKEGEFVDKGDTILKISEIKNEYFDPKLIERTNEQIKSKEDAIVGYENKIQSLENQIVALLNTKALKVSQAINYIEQAELEIKNNSIDLQAAKANYEIADKQLKRIETLYNDGLKSLTDYETSKLKVQETNAKMISAQNKLLSGENKLLNAQAELNSVKNQYEDKLNKSQSDKFSAISAMYDAKAVLSKTINQLANYTMRNDQYYILAPQDGYITKVIVSGLGQIVKEGESIVTIMPAGYDLAVEMYVNPMDLPLLAKGQPVRFMFDGWPSIVFSGWPNSSYGTFGGKVVAIDNFISDNGKYRILVGEDGEDQPWPEGLRVGSGANGMALLKDVPIWYELWRNINGFPPDYYIAETSEKQSKNKSKEK